VPPTSTLGARSCCSGEWLEFAHFAIKGCIFGTCGASGWLEEGLPPGEHRYNFFFRVSYSLELFTESRS